MSQRNALNKQITLTGVSDGGRFSRTFQIQRKIREGASVICYEATHEASGRGILREFYPQSAFWHTDRDEAGQLLLNGDYAAAVDQFRSEMARYLKPYELLLQAMKEPEHRDLQTCIPAFEVYRGGDSCPDSAGTAYIFTTDPESVTFASICQTIRANPKKRPEYHLVKVLSAMISLTEGVRALHRAGLLHRDIKPGNFGFASRGSEALTDAVSLFDIDTVCAMYPLPRERVISQGFTEPEALDSRRRDYSAGCQTDIYSIGATLFSALVLTPETEAAGYVYIQEFRDQLRELLSRSALITASEGNSHPKLRGNLARVLEKCLAPREERYPNCDELLEDLHRALRYALPSHLARKHISGERWVLRDAERSLDQKREDNADLSLLYHLYDHPLYRSCPEAGELRVLVVGFGRFGQRFTDLALTLGQMCRRSLSVTVLTDDPGDKVQYLADRPELSDFFAVDAPFDEKRHYGRLMFAPVRSLEREDRQKNVDILQELIFESCDENRQPHYVFLALGEDGLNRSAAGAVWEASEDFGGPCTVSYVWEGEEPPAEDAGRIPLRIHLSARHRPGYDRLEQMAFGVHCVWNKDFGVPHAKLRAEFRDPYNYGSCVSNAVSLKYKLFSIGIDLDTLTADEAAARFAAEKKTWKQQLIWMEHRRWVTEKLCGGWRRMTDLDRCAPGDTKDKRNKRHICIVRSDPNQNLAAKFRANNYEKWDTATEAELADLDALDRLSVALHRMYVKKAAQLREKDLMGSENMESIRAMVSESREAMAAFRDWQTCVRAIATGDRGRVNLYESLTDALKQAGKAHLPGHIQEGLDRQLKAFDSVFRVILESTRHRDLKQDDVAMIDAIPGILSGRENLYLAVPFDWGDNTRVFSNVAAAAVADPVRLLWLACLDGPRSFQDLTAAAAQAAEFLNRKNLRCGVEFILGYDPRDITVDQGVWDRLKSIFGSRLRQVKALPAQSPVELAREMEGYLTQRRKAQPSLRLERNQTRLSYLLEGAQVYDRFDSYRFDAKTAGFTQTRGCADLGYLRSRAGITVSDLFSLGRSAGQSSQPEFFAEYPALWERYRRNPGAWKLLCNTLQAHSDRQDVLATLSRRNAFGPEGTQWRYLIPYGCGACGKKLLSELKTLEAVGPESTVLGYTNDACEVLIQGQGPNRTAFDAIFASHYALTDPAALRVAPVPGRGEVQVLYDDLVVKHLPVPMNRAYEFRELLRWFAGLGFVTGLREEQDTVRFTYATRQIKELMTVAGKILEVYTYHKARETGKFDDVACSYELTWEHTAVRSEFDCIVTRGFQSLFIECKARTKIDQDYYYKLSSLARQFGVNARAVLIADTLERAGSEFAPVNEMQRQRGQMLDVITVSDPHEIQNIGKTLLSILDGTYETKKQKET